MVLEGLFVVHPVAQQLFRGQDAAGGAAENDRIRRIRASGHGRSRGFTGQAVGSRRHQGCVHAPDLADWERGSFHQGKGLQGAKGRPVCPQGCLRRRQAAAQRTDNPGSSDIDRFLNQPALPGLFP